MHLYTILLTLYDNKQVDVDAFIVSEQPGVAQSPQPLKLDQKTRPQIETIYTRLRNELAHRRTGVRMATTKAEAAAMVSPLKDLVRRAVELHLGSNG